LSSVLVSFIAQAHGEELRGRHATGNRRLGRLFTAAGILALPMSRRDIADYLGLTLETVSRALSRLHDLGIHGFIGNTQRQIMLLDRHQLAALDDLQN
jgi:CRP-like cAMP-binding protein